MNIQSALPTQSHDAIGKPIFNFLFIPFIKCTTNERLVKKMENLDQILVEFNSIEFQITNHFDKCLCETKKKKEKKN